MFFASSACIVGVRTNRHTQERLFDSAYNVDLGAWYLARQRATFGAGAGATDERSVELAAVAYNGGPLLARAYLKDKATLPPETVRYREFVVDMWKERTQLESLTFSSWSSSLKAPATEQPWSSSLKAPATEQR